MTFARLLIYALATHRVLVTWDTGAIFARRRAAVEARLEAAAAAGKSDFLAELLSCPVCLAHWVPVFLGLAGGLLALVVLAFVWPSLGRSPAFGWGASICDAPAFCLAVTDLGLLIYGMVSQVPPSGGFPREPARTQE